MSAEVVSKKRGRPKAAESANSTKAQGTDSSRLGRTKSSTIARDFSTTDTIPEDSLPKKSTRKKQRTLLDGEDVDQAPRPKKSAKSSTTKSKTKTSILDQARGFQTLETKVSDRQAAATELSTKDADIPTRLKIIPETMSSSELETPNPVQQSNHAVQDLLLRDNSEHKPPTIPTSNIQRSLFLSDFLSRSDPVPEVSEESKISDRSAFSIKTPSIDEIVSGIGVSNLSSLEAVSSQKSNRPIRDSAIPITPPKVFKALSLKRFPDSPEPSKVYRKIDPATYTVGSFSSFKSTQPLSTQASMAKAPAPIGPNPILTAQQRAQSQPTSISQQQNAALQTSSRPQHTNPTPSSTSVPAPSPSNQPSRPAAATPAPSRPAPPQMPPGPQIPNMGKKRPTEMSPAELRANPEFKSLRRKWTGLIVGIPVLVATSYVLWNRLDLNVAEEGRLGWDYGGKSQPGRERGMVPGRLAVKADEDTGV